MLYLYIYNVIEGDSMKFNRFLFFNIVTIIFMITFTGNIVRASSIQGNKGMTLDCARTFYSPRLIKKYITTSSKNHASFILLHLTDNERFGVENNYLGQTTRNAREKNGIYFNPKTNKAFISKKQLKNLIQFAQSKNIKLIPEIDLPGHNKGIVQLLKYTKKGRALNKELIDKDGYNQFNFSKKATLDFTEKILSEYLSIMPKGYSLGIGSDEIIIGNKSSENSFVKYINSIDSFINKRGYYLTAWNDSFHKRTLDRYRKNITVFYWSQNGERRDKNERREIMKVRATLPDLINHGFKVVNCNFYYLYIINNHKMYTPRSRLVWKKLLDNWNVRIWDDNNDNDKYTGDSKIDYALCIWNTGDSHYTSVQLYQLSQEYLNEFLNHMD